MSLIRLAVLGLVASVFMSLTFGAFSQDRTLQLRTFNPGTKSLFPVLSTLVIGPSEVLLIDAQFQRDDAQTVLGMIKNSGKDLKTIYISHGDPDFYFGLDVILATYPNAKVLASSSTVEHIKRTVDQKISFWGPILKENAPQKTIVPEVIKGDTLTVDGQELKIIGLNGHDPKHTYVWIPSAKTVTGGVVLYEGMHVWMADMKAQDARDKWRKTLDGLMELKPDRIIPGHVVGKSNENTEAVNFTLEYMKAFEEEATKAADSAALIAAMKTRYPQFTNNNSLEISAKVVKGEMKWP